MRGYKASDPIVRKFLTREKTGQEFTKYELAKVASVEVDLDCWSKKHMAQDPVVRKLSSSEDLH
jgi:hypothetical protein